MDIAVPECEGDVPCILGLLNYNRDYIPQLASEAAVLSDLLKKDIIIADIWTPEIHGEALRRVRQLLTSAPFLQLPDPTKPFRIHVDGCLNGQGKGAILLQQSRSWVPPAGTDLATAQVPWTPVAYWSKKLTDVERRTMSATEVEAAAMHDAIMNWSNYLSNGIKFEVIVDHQALVYLTTAAALEGNKKVLNMILRLQGFWFDVKYRKGEKHTDADALSRLFRYQDDATITFPESEPYFNSIQEADIALLKRRLSLYDKANEADTPEPETSTSQILQIAATLQGQMSVDEDLYND